MRRRVLVTGAAGTVGQAVLDGLEARYDLLLTDIRQPERVGRRGFQVADVTAPDALAAVVRDVDAVVHLAVRNIRSPWSELMPCNIAGTYNVLRAASDAGIRRVVLTSSSQVVEGYPTAPVRAEMAPRPTNLYGASKAAGEALASSFAAQTGLSVICLRIGYVLAADEVGSGRDSSQLAMVITHRDLLQLLVAAIEAPDEWRFRILNGVSNNRVKRLDISETRQPASAMRHRMMPLRSPGARYPGRSRK